jgi:hypothetical protein
MFLLSVQSLTAFLTVSLCVLGVGLLQYPRMQKLLHSNKTASTETLQQEINLERLRLIFLQKLPAFGYDNIIASWVYLNFLQYFGDDEVRFKTGYSLSPEYFEVILKHDPRFLKAYLGLSISTSMYAAKPERTIELIERSLESLSPWVPQNSYYVWRYKAVDELLFLGDSLSAKQSFETAANWASHYSDEEAKLVATVSQRTAEFLSRNPDSRIAKIAAWTMVLNNQVDEKTRKRAISKIEALGGQVITHLDGTFRIKFPEQD